MLTIAARLRASRVLGGLFIGAFLGFGGLVVVPAAYGATGISVGSEVAGNSAASRNTLQDQGDVWMAAREADGAEYETLLLDASSNGATLDDVIATTSTGIDLSVQRARYSLTVDGDFVENSPTPGTATCSGSGTQLQDQAPRPTSLLSNAGCTSGGGFAYSEVGGAGETTSRDGVIFRFSEPVLGFGAWFGDLETNPTDGFAALVRAYDADGLLVVQQAVTPTLNSDNCSSMVAGCGNRSSRWIGVEASAAQPIARVDVIVGELALSGAAQEGVGFIGPSIDVSTTGIELAKDALPVHPDPATPIRAGDAVTYRFTVTNTGSRTLHAVAVVDSRLAVVTCEADTLDSGDETTCTGDLTLTQDQVDAGSLTNTATVSGNAGTPVTSTQASHELQIPSRPGLAVTASTDQTDYLTVGDDLGFEISVTNTGNVTLTGVATAATVHGDPVEGLVCVPDAAALAPGATLTCRGGYRVQERDLAPGSIALSASATAHPIAPGDDNVTSDVVTLAWTKHETSTGGGGPSDGNGDDTTGGGGPHGGPDTSTHPDALPDTGGVQVWPGVLGAVLMLVGSVLVRGRHA